jgi:hypothetical protein
VSGEDFLAAAKARGVQLGNLKQTKANKREADRYAKALRLIRAFTEAIASFDPQRVRIRGIGTSYVLRLPQPARKTATKIVEPATTAVAFVKIVSMTVSRLERRGGYDAG